MPHPERAISKTPLLILILGSLGVVYGDIGTSPLYAVTQIFFGQGQVVPTQASVLGAIGLIIWALTAVVTLKYIVFVLLANHEGQGGVFALLSLLRDVKKRYAILILILLLLGAAGFLFGEGLITPAISILSAVEGLSLATSFFQPYIIPITLGILVLLFLIQRAGTKKIGIIFGPIMVVWFIVIALLGLRQILIMPAILYSLNPVHVLYFLGTLSLRQFLLFFGALVLAITGVESLYADMGHFGPKPIRISWVAVVYPALILNYLGQGAFLLRGIAVHNDNIFYSIVPHTYIIPMVILAACATAIASQALISGAFSLVAQAIALNYLPRVKIIHTNRQEEGQIYVPSANWLLFAGAAILVVEFGTSTALAGAYGFAVSGVMLVTSIAMLSIAIVRWHWNWMLSTVLFGGFAIIDLTFFISKLYTFWKGGYVPALVGIVLFVCMSVWHWGRKVISDSYDSYEHQRTISSLVSFKKKLQEGGGAVVDRRGQFVEAGRTFIFFVPKPILEETESVPVLLRVHMRQNGSIPKHVVLLHIEREARPYVRSDRYSVKDFGFGIYGVEARFGFMEDINLRLVVDYLDRKFQLPGLESGKYLMEVGSEELRTDETTTEYQKFKLGMFRRLQRLATPTYRYFGLSSKTGLTTATIPIIVSDAHAKIMIPELDLTD